MTKRHDHHNAPVKVQLARAAGAFALGVAGTLAGAAAVATLRLNHRARQTYFNAYTFSPYETAISGYEAVRFPTADGLNLSGWWLPQPGSDRLIIGLPGHRSIKADLLGIGSGLWRAGNNVLLFDWRSRGESDVAQHSLAYYELRDAEAALRYATQRMPHAQIGLVGYSMGASVALLLAARSPAIRAVLADSPFTDIAGVVSHGVARYRLPARSVVALADRLTGWRYGYRFGAVRPIDAVAAISPRPLLLIHGSADSLIPLSHAHQLFAAAREPKELWVIPGAEHCGGYFADRQRYVERAVSFFERHLATEITEATEKEGKHVPGM